MQMMQQTWGRHTIFQQLELCISIKVFGLCFSLSGGASATVSDSSLQSPASPCTQQSTYGIEQHGISALQALHDAMHALHDQHMFMVVILCMHVDSKAWIVE